MSGVVHSVLDLIGNTPLLALHRVLEPNSGRVLTKLENLNPSGSVKDRIALAVVDDAEVRGLITRGSHLVWATSGNSGAALAVVAAARQYRLTIFMPSNAPLNQRRLLERYGVDVQLTSPTGGMKGALEAAQDLARTQSNTLLLDLFSNPKVVEAHYLHTAAEILSAAGGVVNAFVAAVGTGGTVTGVGRRLKEANPEVHIVAVEPAGSPVLSTGVPGRHMIPGIGADFVPPLLDREVISEVMAVSDGDASGMSRRLAREEGLLVGVSAGANVFAAARVAKLLGPGNTVVTVLPDTGERYLDFPI